MKRIYFVIAMLCLAASGWAQSTKQVIVLKNGSVIKCDIVEQIPNQSVKIKTSDGSIFVYGMDEVERITMDEPKETTDLKQGRHRGLDFAIQGCYMFGVGSKSKGAKTIPLEIELGKQINKNLYLGLSTGAWVHPDSDNSQAFIPVTFNARILGKTLPSSITPFLGVGLSYGINTESTETSEFDNPLTGKKEKYEVEYPDYVSLQLMPGLSIPMSKTADFLISAGYVHSFPTKGSGGLDYLAVKAGINFHKNQSRGPRPKKEVRNKGMIYNMELGATFSETAFPVFNLGAGYKFNPYLSASAGLGITRYESLTQKQTVTSNLREYTVDGESLYGAFLAPFVRGVYRPFNKRFSPIIGCDIALGFDVGSDKCNSHMFLRPSIGASLRVSANSYMELKAGYSMTGKVGAKGEDYSEWYSYEPVSMSSPFVTIGLTRNLKWFSK